MSNSRIAMMTVALLMMPLLSACERNQDQMTPAAKTEEGKQKAEEYPSTRNAENPDPSVGGTNSAATQPGQQTTPSATASNPAGTGGTGDQTGR